MTEPAWTQLGLLADTDHDHHPRSEVLAFDPSHTTNGQRVKDLARLGYLPSPCLDPTWGHGSMWTEHRPDVLIGHDLDGGKTPDGVGSSVDFTDMPYESDQFASCLYDPPYKIQGTPTDDGGRHNALYGVDVRRSKAELEALMRDGFHECARVTREFLIVKCQDQATGDHGVIFQTNVATGWGVNCGWRLKDSLHLMSYRPQPAGTRQHNARRNYSTFLVFVPA